MSLNFNDAVIARTSVQKFRTSSKLTRFVVLSAGCYVMCILMGYCHASLALPATNVQKLKLIRWCNQTQAVHFSVALLYSLVVAYRVVVVKHPLTAHAIWNFSQTTNETVWVVVTLEKIVGSNDDATSKKWETWHLNCFIPPKITLHLWRWLASRTFRVNYNFTNMSIA